MANYLAATVSETGFIQHCAPDAIVALPSSAERLRSRGYSHTDLLARALAKATNYPFAFRALSSTGKRAAQAGLTAAGRLANVRSRFTACTSAVAERHILLVDDLLTTGSSALEASRALAEAGANRIDVLTIAHSRQFSEHFIRTLCDTAENRRSAAEAQGKFSSARNIIP